MSKKPQRQVKSFWLSSSDKVGAAKSRRRKRRIFIFYINERRHGDKNEGEVNSLDIKDMLKFRVHLVQVTFGLPNCPWERNHAFVDTRAGPNLMQTGAIESLCKTAINYKRPEGLRSAVGTLLYVAGETGWSSTLGSKLWTQILWKLRNEVRRTLKEGTYMCKCGLQLSMTAAGTPHRVMHSRHYRH